MIAIGCHPYIIDEPTYGLGPYMGSSHNSYRERIRTMDAIKNTTNFTQVKVCSVDGCEHKHYGLGFCKPHYRQIRNHGKIMNTSRKGRAKSNRIFFGTDDVAIMILDDVWGNEKARTIIDLQDVPLVSGFKWSIRGGYARTVVSRENGKTVEKSMHQFLVCMNTGKYIHVDHKNGDKLDNRRENLRIATKSQNATNSKMPCTNTSGFRGVHHLKKHNRFTASINHLNRNIYLGCFLDPEEAAEAYDMAAKKLHGEFATLNFP